MDDRRNKLLYILIVLVFLGVFWGWYYFQTSKESVITVTGSEETTAEPADEENQMIMVYVTGQVVSPGVVTIAAGSRLVEVIDQVGGFTELADQSAVNLARRVKDEEKIFIPEFGEEINEAARTSDGRININTADLEELKTLPGIGDVIAQNIIDYREKNGGFTQPEELKNVNRIGDKIYEELCESITI